jgi:hypothetical protein
MSEQKMAEHNHVFTLEQLGHVADTQSVRLSGGGFRRLSVGVAIVPEIAKVKKGETAPITSAPTSATCLCKDGQIVYHGPSPSPHGPLVRQTFSCPRCHMIYFIDT